MPNIKITETEASKIRQFDVTENTVLIPMLWARSAIFVTEVDSEGNIHYIKDSTGNFIIEKDSTGAEIYEAISIGEGKLYTNASDLSTDAAGHIFNLGVPGLFNLDRSYIMAYELLLNGINVVIKPIAISQYGHYDTALNEPGVCYITEAEYIDALSTAIVTNKELKTFEDKNKWNIKFITTGGYANVPLEGINTSAKPYKTLADLADKRGDAVALVEIDRTEEVSEEGVISKVNGLGVTQQNAAVFLPWGVHTGLAVSNTTLTEMPACFSYLMAYANSVKSNANWFAAAGVNRGEVPTLTYPKFEVGEALMHILQRDEATTINNVSVYVANYANVIMNAGTYGYRIWGNKVAKPTNENLVNKFVDFLNVRILLCDIRKQVYHSAMKVMFEPNDDIAWFDFKYLSENLLEKMKTGRGILWYKWTKNKTDEKATIDASLTIRPIEALENIKVNIIMTDEEVVVTTTEETEI